MGQRAVGVPDVAPGDDVVGFATRQRVISGAAVCEQYLLERSARVASFKGIVASPRIGGISTANYNFASLFNVTGSGVLVAVRRLTAQVDSLSVTFGRFFTPHMITVAPTGGTLHEPTALDTALTHNASVEFRSAASADGVITALTSAAGTPSWQQFCSKGASSYGQVLMEDVAVLPVLVEFDPVVLREGEGVLVRMAVGPSSSAEHLVNAMFEEFTLP
jgi:hypothetical protein